MLLVHACLRIRRHCGRGPDGNRAARDRSSARWSLQRVGALGRGGRLATIAVVPDEIELFRRWRAGDEAAGDALLRSCFQVLCRFFRDKVTDGVEDLIQQTLLGCIESREVVRDPERFRAFMFRIARNRLYDRLRERHHVSDRIDVADTSLHDMGVSPSSVVARGERQQFLNDALRRIPLDYQVALELTYWENMRGQQVAEVLEISPNTVRSRLARARAALRDQLVAMGVPDPEGMLVG